MTQHNTKRCNDAFGPLNGRFEQQWHAQVLAMANGLIEARHITPDTWAQALGAALRDGEALGRPDTDESYYLAALSALQTVTTQHSVISAEDVEGRKSAWESAYLNTPHGAPVMLKNAKGDTLDVQI